MAGHVHLYGGFCGVETAREQRDWETYPSVLDGRGRYSEYAEGANNSTLDGFTIAGGRAENGGGMSITYALMTVANCAFTGNEALGEDAQGGGLYVRLAPVKISDCSFTGNACIGVDAASGGAYTPIPPP